MSDAVLNVEINAKELHRYVHVPVLGIDRPRMRMCCILAACERECLGCCRSTMNPPGSEDAEATKAENLSGSGGLSSFLVVPKQLHRSAGTDLVK